MSSPRVCIVYKPGEFGTGTDYEVWVGDCINPGERIVSSPSREIANDVCIRLATSMRIRAMPVTP